MLDDPRCKHEQCCRDGDSADGEIELRLPNLKALWTCDYGKKLDREAEEEEKVELK